jgi:hypothetical protein
LIDSKTFKSLIYLMEFEYFIMTGTVMVKASIASTLWPSLSGHSDGYLPSFKFLKNILWAVAA